MKIEYINKLNSLNTALVDLLVAHFDMSVEIAELCANAMIEAIEPKVEVLHG